MATNGQSVSEVMGNGSASMPNQSFTLKQSPLTYVQAPTPTGRQSTLEVQVNGVKWTEVSTLYQRGPSQPVFTTLNQPDAYHGRSVWRRRGRRNAADRSEQFRRRTIASDRARPATSRAGALSLLIDRPLGVSGVTNPEAATGGQDAQSIGDVRANAPQTSAHPGTCGFHH